MKKNIIIRVAAAFTAIILLMQFASCESYPRKILSEEGDSSSQTIILLKKGDPRCNLSVSDDVMERLLNENQDLLNKVTRYFNVLSDDSVDSNIIYINSRISKYMEGFTAYDKNTYVEAKKNLKMEMINQLKYRDYYVATEDKSMLVVCGSASMTLQVLQTLYDQYFSQGTEKDDKYIMTVPRDGIYSGSYLKGVGIAGNPIRDYTIVYPAVLYYSEGANTAKYLYDYLYENCGFDIPLAYTDSTTNTNKQYEIVIGKNTKNVSLKYYAKNPDLGDYKVVQTGSKLYIMGGSDWAMQYAVDIVIRNYFSQELSIPEGYTITGDIYGKCIFEKYTGSNLRIMSQNIWNNDQNSAVWRAAGLDCSLSSRLDSFATVFMAYAPDIICMQEIKHHSKVSELIEIMAEQGRNYELITCNQKVNYTPLVYNTDTLTLIESGYHKFGYGSDSQSKSYTWGYFKHNETGETFVAISTHLWWMSIKQNSNSVTFRKKQFQELSDFVDEIAAKYNCPCFVAGDMNCTVSTDEYQSALNNGFSDCYDIATEFADNSIGRYTCNQNFYSNQPRVGSYKNAIDHALVKNIGDSKVISYDYITPNFFGKLSDHAPLCLDIAL